MKPNLYTVKANLIRFAFIAIAKGAMSNPTGCLKAINGQCYTDFVIVDFEPPKYTVGDINGQDGWMKTNPHYDVVVAAQTMYRSFGTQSLRYSDAFTSSSFGDQTFAKPLKDSVGEAAATAGTFTVGIKLRHFEMQFDIASTKPTMQQPGLHISISPDRGDGSRMSYLRIDDGPDGIAVIFDDVQGILPAGDPECATSGGCANFVEKILTEKLNRSVPHRIKLTLETLNGPSNDIVKVFIDGEFVHQGTSWEDYYRYDPEAVAEQSPRIVKTVLFRASDPPNSGDLNFGFLIDNLIIGAY